MTFGCKVNQYETQAIREAWTTAGGWEVDNPAQAELIDAGFDMTSDGITNGFVGQYDAVYGLYVDTGIPGNISVGQGITMYIDGLTIDNYANAYIFGTAVGGYSLSQPDLSPSPCFVIVPERPGLLQNKKVHPQGRWTY